MSRIWIIQTGKLAWDDIQAAINKCSNLTVLFSLKCLQNQNENSLLRSDLTKLVWYSRGIPQILMIEFVIKISEFES